MFPSAVPCALLVIVMLAAACGAAPQPAAAPPTPEMTEAPTVEPTSEPTLTPAPTSTPFRRPTLPPTWTPTSTATDWPTRTPTPEDIVVASNNSSTLARCLTFGPDLPRNPGTVEVGRPATVYWTPSGGPVFYYEVVLLDASGLELDSRRMMPSARSYTFDRDLFTFNGVYRWQVTPFDSSANAICQTRTSELRATLR